MCFTSHPRWHQFVTAGHSTLLPSSWRLHPCAAAAAASASTAPRVLRWPPGKKVRITVKDERRCVSHVVRCVPHGPHGWRMRASGRAHREPWLATPLQCPLSAASPHVTADPESSIPTEDSIVSSQSGGVQDVPDLPQCTDGATGPSVDACLAARLGYYAFEAYNRPLGDTVFHTLAGCGTQVTYLSSDYIKSVFCGVVQVTVRLSRENDSQLSNPAPTGKLLCRVAGSSTTLSLKHLYTDAKGGEGEDAGGGEADERRVFVLLRDADGELEIALEAEEAACQPDSTAHKQLLSVPLSHVVQQQQQGDNVQWQSRLVVEEGDKDGLPLDVEVAYVDLEDLQEKLEAGSRALLDCPHCPPPSHVGRPGFSEWHELYQELISRGLIHPVEPIAFIERSDNCTQAWLYADAYNKEILISFRGTDETEDFFTDVSFQLVKLEWPGVPHGMYKLNAEDTQSTAAGESAAEGDVDGCDGDAVCEHRHMVERVEMAGQWLQHTQQTQAGTSASEGSEEGTNVGGSDGDGHSGGLPQVPLSVVNEGIAHAAEGAVASIVEATQKLPLVDGGGVLSQVAESVAEVHDHVSSGVSDLREQLQAHLATDLSITNWMSNLADMIKSSENGEVWVHQGFYSAYMSVRVVLKQMVNELMGSDTGQWSVHVTGHSLGGALATLAAYDLALDRSIAEKSSIRMYNFGSPRVGNTPFASSYNTTVPHSWRVVTPRDIVVKLPGMMGYAHVGHALRIPHDHTEPDGDTPPTPENEEHVDVNGEAGQHLRVTGDRGRDGTSDGPSEAVQAATGSIDEEVEGEQKGFVKLVAGALAGGRKLSGLLDQMALEDAFKSYTTLVEALSVLKGIEHHLEDKYIQCLREYLHSNNVLDSSD